MMLQICIPILIETRRYRSRVLTSDIEILMGAANNHRGNRRSEPLEVRLEREKNPVKRVLMSLGPGLITGASDDDPSGIGTYTTAGASLGLAALWTALLTLP